VKQTLLTERLNKSAMETDKSYPNISKSIVDAYGNQSIQQMAM